MHSELWIVRFYQRVFVPLTGAHDQHLAGDVKVRKKAKVKYVGGERDKHLLEFIIKMVSDCVFFLERDRERASEQGDEIQGFMKEKDKN